MRKSLGSSILCFILFVSLFLNFFVPQVFSLPEDEEFWFVVDRINPTLDTIEWFEEGERFGPPSWIEDGRWYYAHSRIILVKSGNYIFASFYESFNWTAVNASLGLEGWHSYPSFEDFRDDLINDPTWWLLYSWGIEADWLGVSSNTTKVELELPGGLGTSTAILRISCHITNIPGFFIAERTSDMGIGMKKLPSPLFAGFDVTSIYIGDFEALQWYEDYTLDLRHFKIFFTAPANVLSKLKDTYSLSLRISPHHVDQFQNFNRFINISMPSDTEVEKASPSNMSTYSENTVTFIINEGDRYPEVFSVTSGPPKKSFIEFFTENARQWVTEPSTWVTFLSLIAIGYTAFQGKRVWDRRKIYYRLYRSMINLFDHYSHNFPKFYEEIESMSKSITNYFIEGRINDDQFDKLLTRRDDLIERATKIKEMK